MASLVSTIPPMEMPMGDSASDLLTSTQAFTPPSCRNDSCPQAVTSRFPYNVNRSTNNRDAGDKSTKDLDTDLSMHLGLPLKLLQKPDVMRGNARGKMGDRDIRCHLPPSFRGPWRPSGPIHSCSAYTSPYPRPSYFSKQLGLPGGKALLARRSGSERNRNPPNRPSPGTNPSIDSSQGEIAGLPPNLLPYNGFQVPAAISYSVYSPFGPAAALSVNQVPLPSPGANASTVTMGVPIYEEPSCNFAPSQALLTPQDILQLQNALCGPPMLNTSTNLPFRLLDVVPPGSSHSRSSTGSVDLPSWGVSQGHPRHLPRLPDAEDLEDVDGEPLDISSDSARTPGTVSSPGNSPDPQDVIRATVSSTRDISTRTTGFTEKRPRSKPSSSLQEFARRSGFCPKCAAGNCDGVWDTRLCLKPCFACQRVDCDGRDC